eukprot:gene12160-16850_t
MPSFPQAHHLRHRLAAFVAEARQRSPGNQEGKLVGEVGGEEGNQQRGELRGREPWEDWRAAQQ